MPYITIKQLLFLGVGLTLLTYLTILNFVPRTILFSIAGELTATVILPWIKGKLHYSRYLQQFLFGLPLFVPYIYIIFNHNQKNIKNNIYATIVPIIFIIIFWVISFKKIKKICNSIIVKFPIKKTEFLVKIIGIIYQISCEELFFRGVVMNIMVQKFSNYIAIVCFSSILFAYSHLINRWAPKIFSIYSYIGQFTLSLVIGWYYLKGLPLYACIMIHFLYNIESWLPLLLRLRSNTVDWSKI